MDLMKDNDNAPAFFFHCVTMFAFLRLAPLQHTPSNSDHGLFIDLLLLPVCGTKRMKLDLHQRGFEINWAADRSKFDLL